MERRRALRVLAEGLRLLVVLHMIDGDANARRIGERGPWAIPGHELGERGRHHLLVERHWNRHQELGLLREVRFAHR